MWIKLNKSVGLGPGRKPGKEKKSYEVTDQVGKELVLMGVAEETTAPKKKAESPAGGTAPNPSGNRNAASGQNTNEPPAGGAVGASA